MQSGETAAKLDVNNNEIELKVCTDDSTLRTMDRQTFENFTLFKILN